MTNIITFWFDVIVIRSEDNRIALYFARHGQAISIKCLGAAGSDGEGVSVCSHIEVVITHILSYQIEIIGQDLLLSSGNVHPTDTPAGISASIRTGSDVEK